MRSYEDVFRLDVAMEEVVLVDVLQAGQDLKQYALDRSVVQSFVLACLDQLVEIAVHEFHCNVKLFAEWIQKDV